MMCWGRHSGSVPQPRAVTAPMQYPGSRSHLERSPAATDTSPPAKCALSPASCLWGCRWQLRGSPVVEMRVRRQEQGEGSGLGGLEGEWWQVWARAFTAELPRASPPLAEIRAQIPVLAHPGFWLRGWSAPRTWEPSRGCRARQCWLTMVVVNPSPNPGYIRTKGTDLPVPLVAHCLVKELETGPRHKWALMGPSWRSVGWVRGAKPFARSSMQHCGCSALLSFHHEQSYCCAEVETIPFLVLLSASVFAVFVHPQDAKALHSFTLYFYKVDES